MNWLATLRANQAQVAPIRLTKTSGKNREYEAWIASQPPLVPGAGRITVHHVRRHGEPKNDYRTVPLPSSMHFIQENSKTSVEALGREGFQAYHGVDFEAAIRGYNEAWEQETGRQVEPHRPMGLTTRLG